MHGDRPLVAIEAEHGVLGALMHAPEQCEEIGAFLDPAHFSEEDHGALYTMILGCHSKKVKPDSITLSEIRTELPSGELTIVYASEIMRNVPSAANAKRYAQIIVERSHARELYATGQRLMELAQERGRIPDQIAQAQNLVMELNPADETPDVVTLRSAMLPVFDAMEERWKGPKSVGLKFNLPDLDGIVKGLRPGNLVIIAGRPGTGKTVLGTGLADEICVRNGGSALIFSLEMNNEELAKRSLASLATVDQDSIDSGQALEDGDAIARMTTAVARVSEADVRLCDKPALAFSRLSSIARFEHRAKKLDLIVVDYIGLIQGDPSWKHQNRNQELGAISRGLKALAKELKVPIVALAQLNRSIETRGEAKPKMSDLRDSGEIEQDADVIIMAHRDKNSEKGQRGITEVDVVKCRHAQIGGCDLQFQGEYARFVSSSQRREEQQFSEQERRHKPSARSFMEKY